MIRSVAAAAILVAACSATRMASRTAASPSPSSHAAPTATPTVGSWPAPTATARFESTRPPGSDALPGGNGLLTVGGTTYAASNQGIFTSLDERNWHRAVARFAAWDVVRAADGAIVALGGAGRRQSPALATSVDGRTWSVRGIVGPPGDDHLALTGIGRDAIALAVSDIENGAFDQGAWRSSDGGRTWKRWRAGDHFSDVAFTASGRVAYATVLDDSRGCVARSDDGGLTWTYLPKSCPHAGDLYVVEVTPSGRVFVGGGTAEKFGGSQVVRESTDGGTTWRTVWSTPVSMKPNSGNEVTRLSLDDAGDGWLMTGGCTMGANGPCGGQLYRVASDRVTPLRVTGLDVTANGDGVAVVTGSGLLVSHDSGATWSAQAQPRLVVSVPPTNTGGTLFWNTSLGGFTATSAAAQWDARAPDRQDAVFTAGVPTPSDVVQVDADGQWMSFSPGGGGPDAVLVSGSGTTWQSVSIDPTHPEWSLLQAGLGADGVAYAVVGSSFPNCLSASQVAAIQSTKPGWQPSDNAAALYVSRDAGRTWKSLRTLPFSTAATAPIGFDGEDIALLDQCQSVELSTDSGRRWHALTSPGSSTCSLSSDGVDLWYGCDSTLYVSADFGRTWTATNLPTNAPITSAVVAIGNHSAIASDTGSLWVTHDDGRTWTQTWPSLRGE